MSTWFVNEKISSAEVGGFIAEAILHDLRVNSFTFTGFPEVFVRWDDNAFYVSLGLCGNKTSELELGYSAVKKCIGLFRENKLVDQVMIRKIQNLVVEVEGFGRVAPVKDNHQAGNESIVVYGPQVCGKTKNKQLLQSIFGFETVLDGWDGKVELPSGVLALTNIEPPYIGNVEAVSYSNAFSFKNWLKTQGSHSIYSDLYDRLASCDDDLHLNLKSKEDLLDYLAAHFADYTQWSEAMVAWGQYESWLANISK